MGASSSFSLPHSSTPTGGLFLPSLPHWTKRSLPRSLCISRLLLSFQERTLLEHRQESALLQGLAGVKDGENNGEHGGESYACIRRSGEGNERVHNGSKEVRSMGQARRYARANSDGGVGSLLSATVAVPVSPRESIRAAVAVYSAVGGHGTGDDVEGGWDEGGEEEKEEKEGSLGAAIGKEEGMGDEEEGEEAMEGEEELIVIGDEGKSFERGQEGVTGGIAGEGGAKEEEKEGSLSALQGRMRVWGMRKKGKRRPWKEKRGRLW
ncbi:unnamed protein product [Closterium sp. NIES-64]|nr:unnamed protein product [Closterium sp. NIES-64]